MHRVPIIGICAMDYKARSKPMRNILSHLIQNQEFEVIIFGDQVILEEPVDQWPKCDILISFFSQGFPLQKGIDYYRLVKPYSVNDLLMQELLLDRRMILAVLDAIDVPTPPRIISNTDRPKLSSEALSMITRDFGIDFYGPSFSTEEPCCDADSLSKGGRLIKKPFVEKPADAENHNINVYYSGGSGRRLFRKIENKSSEYDENLSEVRRDGKSYIYEEFLAMDNAEDVKVYTVGPYHAYAETRRSPSVNGVVKRNSEGKEIRHVTQLTEQEQNIASRICMAFGQTICGFDMLRANGKSYVIDVNGWSFVKGNPEYDELCAKVLRDIFLKIIPRSIVNTKRAEVSGQWKLKCFVEVLRHADRTPKMKFKLGIEPDQFSEIDTIVSREERLETALKTSKELLANTTDVVLQEKLAKLVEIIERKSHLQSTKIQRRATTDGKAMVIIKWGGEFTHAGRHQAQELGESTRKDISILNKTILSDLKIHCSVERRVQATADVFSKGLLKVAEVPPSLISSRPDILDHASVAKLSLEDVKKKLLVELNDKERGEVVTEMLESFRQDLVRMRDVMRKNLSNLKEPDLNDFQWCCSESPNLFGERWEKHFSDILDAERIDPARISDLYDSLKFDVLHNREFMGRMVTDNGSDHDVTGETIIRGMFCNAQYLFAFLSPKEIGLTTHEKLKVSMEIIGPLLSEIAEELKSSMEGANGKMRLYFTKESHMVSLMNVIVHSGLPLARRRTSSVLFPEEITEDLQWFGELDYLSQICFEVYEKQKIDPENGMINSAHSLRIGMSPGAHDPHLLDINLDRRHSLSVSRKQWITNYIPLQEALFKIEKLLKGPIVHTIGSHDGGKVLNSKRKRRWDLDDQGAVAAEKKVCIDHEETKEQNSATGELTKSTSVAEIAAKIKASLAAKGANMDDEKRNIIEALDKSTGVGNDNMDYEALPLKQDPVEKVSSPKEEPSLLASLGIEKEAKSKMEKVLDTFASKISAKLDINDTRHRYYLTKASTQERIEREHGITLISKGKYYPDRRLATEKDPPLFLEIHGECQDKIDEAMRELKEIMEKGPVQSASTTSAPAINNTFHSEKVFLEIEPTEAVPVFTIRGKILGPQGSFLKHIQQQTGCKVHLRGKGSGYIELGATEEVTDDLHLYISGMKSDEVENAKQLALDLIQHVRKDVESEVAAAAAAKSAYSGYTPQYGYPQPGQYNPVPGYYPPPAQHYYPQMDHNPYPQNYGYPSNAYSSPPNMYASPPNAYPTQVGAPYGYAPPGYPYYPPNTEQAQTSASTEDPNSETAQDTVKSNLDFDGSNSGSVE